MDPSSADPAGGSALLEVGRITKAHGLRGEVIVFLVSDREERVQPGSVLESDRGPLRVAASRRHQDRWIVTFEGTSTREGAEALRGVVLSAEPLPGGDGLWVHELIGCTVVTPDGVERGTVESVMDNPAADLLVLDTGALVPVVFVVGTPSDGVVRVDTPDGLFELIE
ncbi:MAG: ribosome maturation factor RimM [Microthrixaceae bacterium]